MAFSVEEEISLAVSPGERFQPSEYRDKPFALLFLVHLLVFLGLFVFAAVYYTGLPSADGFAGDEWQHFIVNLSTGDVFGILGVLAACGVVGAVYSVIWLLLLKKFPRTMLIISLVFASLIFFIVGGVILAIGAFSGEPLVAIISACVFFGMGLLMGLCYFFWRKKIPFTSLVLTSVCHILEYQTGNFFVAVGSVVVYFVWFIFWASGCILAQSLSYWNETAASVVLLFFLFSFFWTTEVIKNTVHVTVAGAVASWYFRADATPGEATKNALKRATTTSFGSICFGSLLIAIISFLRALADSPSSSNDHIIVTLFKCFLRCILSMLENLIRFFNKYAFTQVAIYGKPYWQAAKSTWALLTHFGIDTIINDTLIGNALALGIIGGAVATCIPAIVVVALFDSADPNVIYLQFFLGIFVGLGIVSVCLSVVDSATATLFVCICEDPAALQRNFPELHAHLQQAYAEGCKNLFIVRT